MFKTKIGKFLLLTIAMFCVFSVSVFSQAAIKTENGYLFINNGKEKSFTVEVTGKNVKTVKNENPTFSIDDRILQLLTVANKNFTDKQLGEDELLEAHKVWESDYLATEVFKKKLTVEAEKVTVNDRKTLFWIIKRPAYTEEFDRDVYMTTIIGNSVFGLSSPIEPETKKADMQKIDLMRNKFVVIATA
jgi:hypothetical protein